MSDSLPPESKKESKISAVIFSLFCRGLVSTTLQATKTTKPSHPYRKNPGCRRLHKTDLRVGAECRKRPKSGNQAEERRVKGHKHKEEREREREQSEREEGRQESSLHCRASAPRCPQCSFLCCQRCLASTFPDNKLLWCALTTWGSSVALRCIQLNLPASAVG